jgi:hypothetical protein
LDLHGGEVVFHPRHDLVVVVSEGPPGIPVAVDPMGPHGLDDLADELVAQLPLAPGPVQAEATAAST